MKAFEPGQRVAFSCAFLKSTGQITGETPFLRGIVESCQPIGQRQLCHVLWDGREKAQSVISSNLVLLEKMHLEPA